MIEFYTNSKQIMHDAGFPLKEWNSNLEKLAMEASANGDISKDGSVNKMLGLLWDTKADSISTKPIIFDELADTKRKIVSEVPRLFDIVGYTLPTGIGARIFMQTLWKQKFSWDEKLPPPPYFIGMGEYCKRIEQFVRDIIATKNFN